jgi:hypothetical protein
MNGPGIIQNSGPEWRENRRFTLHVLRDFGVGKTIIEDRILMETGFMIDFIKTDVMQNKNTSMNVNLNHSIEICVTNIINHLLFNRRFEHVWT